VLEINGASAVYTLGNDISTHFTKADLPIVRIEKDSRGLYRTGGTINGQPVNFIVDTGATVVAINANQAKTLGIEFGGKVTQVETASGKSKAYPVTLQQITLGDIHVYNVPAVIVQGNSPPEILLGMSFLNRLEMHDHDQLLELRQKY
jgi:aspartyl protease family protein